MIHELISIILPLVLIVIITNLTRGGSNFTITSLKPKLSKLNPINGIKKIFSMKRILNKKLVLRKSTISIYALYGGHDTTHNDETETSSSAYHEPTQAPTPIDDTNPRLNSIDPMMCN